MYHQITVTLPFITSALFLLWKHLKFITFLLAYADILYMSVHACAYPK